jgi:hypothetical protein
LTEYRRITRSEMVKAIALARAAGLWRLDERRRDGFFRRALPMMMER